MILLNWIENVNKISLIQSIKHCILIESNRKQNKCNTNQKKIRSEG